MARSYQVWTAKHVEMHNRRAFEAGSLFTNHPQQMKQKYVNMENWT